MPTLELPYVQENNQLGGVHFHRFLAFSHNQQDEESYKEIELFQNLE